MPMSLVIKSGACYQSYCGYGQGAPSAVGGFTAIEPMNPVGSIRTKIKMSNGQAPIKQIEKIHWSTSQECSMSCGYCYLYRVPNCAALSTSEAKHLICDIAGIAQWIVFGGGDPLVRLDLADLLEFAHGNGLHVDLQTNTVGLENHDVNRIFRYIDKIGLSLDSYDHEIHDEIRGRYGNFAETMEALALAVKKEKDIVLRTTLTKKNVGFIDRIALIVKKHENLIKKWSIREFAPLGRGKENVSEYQHTAEALEVEQKRITAMCQNLGLSTKVTFIRKDEMDNCYFMISANGDVYSHPSIGDYRSIGSIRNNPLGELVDCLDYDQGKRALRGCTSCKAVNTLDT